MQTSSNTAGRRAPLALRESVESRLGEVNEMKDFRRFEKPRDLKLPSAGLGGDSREFYDLSRKQQNVKMYKVRFSARTHSVSHCVCVGGGARHTDDVLRMV